MANRQERLGRHLRRNAHRRPISFRDYYHHAFAAFNEEIVRRGMYSEHYSAERQLYWQEIPAQTYEPKSGSELVQAYIEKVAAEMCARLSSSSLAYWIHLYRRLAPGAIGMNQDPVTIAWVRATVESAAQKWTSNDLCNRIAYSDQVPPESILGGHLVANDSVGLQAVLSNQQLVLTDVGPRQIVELLEIEKLAYEVWKGMSLLRILGKGAELVVDHHHKEIVFDDRSDELDTLVRIYDSRNRKFDTSATGTAFSGDSPRNELTFVFPIYNVSHVTFTELAPAFEIYLHERISSISDDAYPNFLFASLNLPAYYQAHLPFSDAFNGKHNVSFESVIGLLAAMGLMLPTLWAADRMIFMRHIARGYDGPSKVEMIIDSLEPFVESVVASLHLRCTASQLDLAAAVEFLSLRDSIKADIDIGYAGPLSVFLPTGDGRVFVDYAHIGQRLFSLFYGVQVSDQNFKGSALEIIVHEGESILPTKPLRGSDGSRKQIDAAFAAGETLIVCECKAVGRSIAVDRGDPRAIDKRIQVVEEAMTQADDKAKWLSAHQLGGNYDIRNFKRILPVGITPFAEFIPSLDSRYWIAKDLPRVLTPTELREGLQDGSIAAASISSANAVALCL